ncbi:EAL domain-containing protein (putative c-di-GMP-specific phosphodiesterase class I) [Novosphingobium kunmingense]|uniref:EAL domain-containing protein (Putative c-di-GMP-specific phosphodiesterase class I) n=1 Tax=Novosphingobium kunmingense TaxID=1211806 RepID=A0A2N0I1S7_9SPHN|nr:GGDEF domain-containing phosphodiesterase [Novosphingobium kunmingense]PKB25134.1 EAL domain-containing protein (putative c-di-GMP-specific phosphodiesterase class I) [Novosphingobium kunmingense]
MAAAMKGSLAIAEDSPHDVVTGLATRDAARVRLTRWLDDGRPVQAMLIGLRRFDAINLAYGKGVGDAALAEVAQRLKSFAASEMDGLWLVARTGGGQFLIASAEPCSRESWQVAAEQLLGTLGRSFAVQATTLRLSPRAALLRGLVGEDADSMLDRLAQALSRVMDRPGGLLLGWGDGEGSAAGHSAAQFEADLLRAIDDNSIELVFQPQFACADDRLLGAEALARWNHSKVGRIGAGALFAIAERADHVAPLSRHIARLAMQQARAWPMDLRLSLNVTPNDLAAADFADRFAALAGECSFPLWRLTLEVTEQVLVADIGHAARSLAALSARGARIALDDFGAGFCNFRYLKLLPLHKLKLDRSMVDGIVTDPRDLAVLRGIVAMARALDLEVIAEGIESEAQRVMVAAEGCSAYQGFLRAPPLSGDAFLALATGA